MTAHSTALPAPAERFIAEVLALKPRIAAFDCDGTLWRDNAGEDFLDWEIERGLVSPEVVSWVQARFDEYRAGRVDEETMCGEMVTIHRGIRDEVMARAAAEFAEQHIATCLFPEMVELTRRLRDAGCELWAVSSTNDWVVRAGLRYFSFDPRRIIAASVRVEEGCATDRLIRVPTDGTKATAIRQLLARMPDAAFGNSRHDLHMLELAQHAFAINPNPDLEQVAGERGWRVYHPSK